MTFVERFNMWFWRYYLDYGWQHPAAGLPWWLRMLMTLNRLFVWLYWWGYSPFTCPRCRLPMQPAVQHVGLTCMGCGFLVGLSDIANGFYPDLMERTNDRWQGPGFIV